MIFIKHISDLCTGVLASLIPIFFLYAVGLLLTPTRFMEKVRGSPQPAVYAAALIVLCCWYGFKLGISLSSMGEVLTSALLILLLIRMPSFKRMELARSDAVIWALKFALLYGLFYAIAYVFMMPSGSNKYLPIARAGNNDILNYANISAYLQRLGPSNIAGFSFKDSIMVHTIPAVYDAIACVSFLFGGETIDAIMPTIFGAIAIIGCIIFSLSRRYFLLTPSVSIGIVSIVISGPFMRYIIGNYFLSTFIGILFVLLMLSKTIKFLIEERSFFWNLSILSFIPYYFLIIYSYPPLLIIGVSLQSGLVFLFELIRAPKTNGIRIANIINELSRWVFMIFLSILFVCILDAYHFITIIKFILQLSAKGIAGWPLNFISPFAVIGIPVSLEVAGAGNQWLTIGVFLVGMFGIVWFYHASTGRGKTGFTHIGDALVALTIFTFVIYFAYFLYIGPSYQQWKTASYFPLFLSFSIFAALFSLISMIGSKKYKSALTIVSCGVCTLTICANLTVHFFEESPPEKFSSSYANLQAIDKIGDFKEVSFKMTNYSSTFFPVYFVRNKLLHLISPSYYPQEEINWDSISPIKPLFIEGDACEIKSSNLTIDGVGCLYFDVPDLVFERQYSFSTNIPGLIKVLGLSAQEAWGRWSDGYKVELWLMVDRRSIPPTQDVRYINLQVSPFLFSNLTGQNISVAWGNEKSEQKLINSSGWISLPFKANDLSGIEARELHLSFELPNAASPNDFNTDNADTRKLGIGFISVSITPHPLGSVLGD